MGVHFEKCPGGDTGRGITGGGVGDMVPAMPPYLARVALSMPTMYVYPRAKRKSFVGQNNNIKKYILYNILLYGYAQKESLYH